MGSNAQSAKGNPASKRMQNQKLKSKRIANKARNERDRAAGTRLKTLREDKRHALSVLRACVMRDTDQATWNNHERCTHPCCILRNNPRSFRYMAHDAYLSAAIKLDKAWESRGIK